MSHALEMVKDPASGEYIAKMVYCGEKPWHNLGTKRPQGLTPSQFIEGILDFEVEKVPTFFMHDGKEYPDRAMLIRKDKKGDDALLGPVSSDWHIIQNSEAASFFDGIVAAGDGEMETAGSLFNGQICWFMAKLKESFSLFKGKDEVNFNMVFTNPFRYAMSQSTMITSTRVVCQNTHRIAYSEASKSGKVVKHRHRTKFDSEKTLEKFGLTLDGIKTYKEAATLLAKKKAKNEDIVEYFKRVLPAYQNKSGKEMGRNASIAMQILATQPGADFANGTWWNAYNAVTFLVDHHIGDTDDSRMYNAFYGPGVTTKEKALNLALEYAA